VQDRSPKRDGVFLREEGLRVEGGFLLRSVARLKGGSVWKKVGRGDHYRGDYLLIRSLPAPGAQVGVSVSTQIDKRATVRNRLKRVLRSILAGKALPSRLIAVSVRKKPEEGAERAVFLKDIDQWLSRSQ